MRSESFLKETFLQQGYIIRVISTLWAFYIKRAFKAFDTKHQPWCLQNARGVTRGTILKGQGKFVSVLLLLGFLWKGHRPTFLKGNALQVS